MFCPAFAEAFLVVQYELVTDLLIETSRYLNGLDPIQVGGIENMPLDYPTSEYIEYTYFTGCIRKVTENLEMYDLGYPVKVVDSPMGCTIMAECPDCKNGGYCTPGFSRSVCTCTMGYVGDDCSGRKLHMVYRVFGAQSERGSWELRPRAAEKVPQRLRVVDSNIHTCSSSYILNLYLWLYS